MGANRQKAMAQPTHCPGHVVAVVPGAGRYLMRYLVRYLMRYLMRYLVRYLMRYFPFYLI